MTLNDKFFYTTFFYSNENRCEEIADDFAIGFGQWLIKKEHEYTNKIIAMEELLEIYKKEKGL